MVPYHVQTHAIDIDKWMEDTFDKSKMIQTRNFGEYKQLLKTALFDIKERKDDYYDVVVKKLSLQNT